MYRGALAAYLAFVTVAGPWLCCCSAARATTHLKPTKQRADEAQPACCRHHTAKAPVQAPRERSHRDGPDSGCPCGNDLNRATATLDHKSEQSNQSAPAARNLLDSASLPPSLLALAAEGIAPVPRERQALPFLTAYDLLRVMHLLRC